MFFAGGGSGDAERCVFAGYGGERAVRYAGIRKGSGGEEIAAWRQVSGLWATGQRLVRME